MDTPLLLPDCVEIIPREDKYIFFNAKVPSWLVTNVTGAMLLSLCDGRSRADIVDDACSRSSDDLRPKFKELLDHAVEQGLFLDPDDKECRCMCSGMRLSIVQLSISRECNLNCRYCYATDRVEQGERKMTLDDYRRVIDDLCAINPRMRFSLTGGESLLNPDVFDIAAHIRSHGCYVDILTNATLITPGNVHRIKACFDQVSISLDGSDAELHDMFRGRGSHDRTMRSIKLLQQHEVPYCLSMTVNRLNIHDVEAMASRYGSLLSFQPLFKAGNAAKAEEDISITGLQYYEALSRAAGVNPLSYCESSLDAARRERACKCAVGDSEVSISATGDVYPCQLLHYPEFHMGNVLDTPVVDIYTRSAVVDRCRRLTVDNLKGCSTCFLRYVCGGACRARAYHEAGDIAASSDFCDYEKNAYLDGILKLYSHNHLK